MKKIYKLIISLIIPQLAGGIGSFFTFSSVKDWYPVLVRPALNPPSWVFGPVWTTLFLLMGYALYLVWTDGNGKSKRLAYWAFGIQIVLNTLWSIIFFGLHSPGGAFIEVIFLWLAILATIIVFAKISRLAACAVYSLGQFCYVSQLFNLDFKLRCPNKKEKLSQSMIRCSGVMHTN